MKNNYKNIADEALDIALKNGCSSARVSLNITSQNSFSFLNNKLDRLHSSTGASLYIQLYSNQRYGTFSTNRLNLSELDREIKKEIKSTLILEKDPFRGLADKNLYYNNSLPPLDQYDNSFASIKTEKKKEIAFDAASEIFQKDPKILSINSEYSDSEDYFYMIDSQGFIGETNQTLFSLNVECSVKGRGDKRPEAWWFEASMFFDKLKKADVGNTALNRALGMLNPKKIKTGIYNLVVENSVASKLIAPIISSLNGAAIQQNNSFLKNSLEKEIFSKLLNIYDEPHLINALGSRYFDGEGIATKNSMIVEDGVIKEYFINSYYSKKMGIPITIEGPSVLKCRSSNINDNDSVDLNDLLKMCNSGVLVTGFNGGNSNSTTGDFSYGVQGFYFENGILLFPINEMIITGNIIDLWKNLISTGTDERDVSRWTIPSLAFSNISFSGN